MIKRQAGDFIQKRGHHDKGNGITEGKAMISSILPKDLLSLVTHSLAISGDLEVWLYVGEKR
ncbi:MAG: hypothetical protein HY574_01505 [candidate division NC10 bacterium]|nr:hypothetical protein [candidate division NC10 bacterium]